jgi:hypothetical protein
MKCPNCRSDNREGVKFCEEGGTKIEMVCPGCGTRIPSGKKFCGECGQPLDAPIEVAKIDYCAPQSYTPKHLADKILTKAVLAFSENIYPRNHIDVCS